MANDTRTRFALGRTFEQPVNISSKGSIFGELAGGLVPLAQLFLGNEARKQFGTFANTQFPEFNLPNQLFGEAEARLLAERQGARLRSAGVNQLERSGLDTPSRSFGVQRSAAEAESNLLAQLLGNIDQSNLQRATTSQQFAQQRQERKGGIASSLGDIAGIAGAVLPFIPGIGGVAKGASTIFSLGKKLFGGLF